MPPPNQRRSGLDSFYARQNMPMASTFQRNQSPNKAAALDNMQQNYNELLPPSQQRSTPVGRSRNSPDRIAERELRLQSRQLDRALSPFAQADMRNRGFSQPQQMARGSVFGAMQPAPSANPAMPQTPILGPTFTTYR
jgi:hypothetical protein